jgi:inward rectifier potassium channel
MANNRHLHISSKENKDTGFGTNANNQGGRSVNKDGTMNVRREGVDRFTKLSIFQAMLTMPLWKFIVVILAFYFSISLVFAGIYFIIGLDQLQGMMDGSMWNHFKEVFYFSTQTFTTLGYGRINPVGDAANIISSLEALTGFLSFAIATGLIYGRFAKPDSYLVFSENALISPFHGHTALMFRLVQYKEKHALTDVEIVITLGMTVNEDGKQVYKFYRLDLERSKIDSLAMNWTIVHPIDEKSPLHGFTEDDMKNSDIELYVLVRGFDEIFSSTVQKRTSYTYNEILFHKKFVPMYHDSEDGRTTILELHKLNDFVDVSIKKIN